MHLIALLNWDGVKYAFKCFVELGPEQLERTDIPGKGKAIHSSSTDFNYREWDSSEQCTQGNP